MVSDFKSVKDIKALLDGASISEIMECAKDMKQECKLKNLATLYKFAEDEFKKELKNLNIEYLDSI